MIGYDIQEKTRKPANHQTKPPSISHAIIIIMRPDDFKLLTRIARIYFNTTCLYGMSR